MSLDLREKVGRAVVVLLVIALLTAAIMALAWNEIGNEIFLHNERFRYTTITEEITWSAEVLDIVREQGKEPIYVIGLNGSKLKFDAHELTETEYSKYIGEGNNAITVKKATLNLWLAKNPFNGDISSAWLYQAQRIQYPWSDPIETFTDEDAISLVAAFIDSGERRLEVPFECDFWDCFDSIGMSQEKESAKEIG